MGYINLINVALDRVVAQAKVATIKYKLASDPDSNFITKTATANLEPTSPASSTLNFSPMVTIDGLINGASYTVEVLMNCSGLGVRFTTSAGTTTTTTTEPPPSSYNLVINKNEANDEVSVYVNDVTAGASNTYISTSNDVINMTFSDVFQADHQYDVTVNLIPYNRASAPMQINYFGGSASCPACTGLSTPTVSGEGGMEIFVGL